MPDRPHRRLAVFLVLVVLLYTAGVSTQWRVHGDSLLYMGLARSLAEDHAYTFNGEPHTYVWPGLPLFLAPVYAVFGESFPVMNALMALLAVGCVAAGHLLFRRLPLTERQVWTCTLLFGLSRSLHYYSTVIITEVPFTLLALACLYCGHRMSQAGRRGVAWCLGAGASAFGACCFRPVGWALYPALVAGLWSGRVRADSPLAAAVRTLLIGAPVALLGGLWALRTASLGRLGSGYFGDYIARPGALRAARTIVSNLGDALKPLSDTILGYDLGMAGSVVLLVPILIGLAVAWRRGERQVSVYAAASFLGVCLAHPSRRYLMPILPVFVFWLVLGASAIGSAASRRTEHGELVRRAGIWLLALVLAANVLRTGKLIYEARLPWRSENYRAGRIGHYFDLIDWLPGNVLPGDCVLAEEYRLVHYFTRIRTTPPPRAWQVRKAGGWRRAFLAHPEVTLIVLDPKAEPLAEAFDPVTAGWPDAVRTVRHFGPLELVRVRPERLR